MLLCKDGVTVDFSNPLDIARFKKMGYAEVKPEPEKAAKVASEQKTVLTAAEKKALKEAEKAGKS